MPGIDQFTKLLLHFKGPDESVDFIDSSPSRKIITAIANAKIDTAKFKFGGSSGLFDGTDDCLTALDSDDWNFADDDFTIDFWEIFNSIAAVQGFFAQSNVGGYSPVMLLYNSVTGKLNLYTSITGAAWSINAQAGTKADFAINTLYHIAVVRHDDEYKVYVDGVADITKTQAGALMDSGGVFTIGANGIASIWVNGWIDEFRVSKGIARWTANFTPPASAYSPAGGFFSFLNE